MATVAYFMYPANITRIALYHTWMLWKVLEKSNQLVKLDENSSMRIPLEERVVGEQREKNKSEIFYCLSTLRISNFFYYMLNCIIL